MNNNKGSYYLFLAFISPVLAMYLACRSESQKFIVLSGTLFMGLLGSVFIYLVGNDGHSHLMDVYKFYLDMSLLDFLYGLGSLLIFQPYEASSDLYKHIISYLAGGVFQIPELIHLFGGLLLGFFFTKSVFLVLENKPKQKAGFLLYCFIGLFLISSSISALNSLRMWTAMWVFFYGSFGYIKRKDKKFIWIIVLSFFIHFSYMIFIIPVILVIFLKKNRLLIFGVFVSSFFVNIGQDQISDIMAYSGVYEDRQKIYLLDQDTIESRDLETTSKAVNLNFYKSIGVLVYLNFSIILLAFTLSLIYLKGTSIESLDFLIAAGLMILAFSNLASFSSPAIEGRGYSIASIFLVAGSIQILCLKDLFLVNGFKTRIIKYSFHLFLISSIPYILFNIADIFSTISYFSIIMPIGSWLLGNEDISIRDFLVLVF